MSYVINYPVSFNDNRIDTISGVTVYQYNATNLPEREINMHKLARRSKSIITSSEYVSKNVFVYMRVNTGTRAQTEATLTQIKGVLQAQNGELVVEHSGLQVRYTATMNEFNIEWRGKSAYVELVFISSTPIAESLTTSVLANMNITTSSASVTFTVGGSALTEPRITVVLTSITGGTGGTVVLYNSVNNQGITIDRNFAAGDILEIDSAEMSVTHNGSEVDFTGAFPTFAPGVQQLAYTDTFTTRNVDVSLTSPTMIV